jgi:succinate dehydrogenase / fumarate reductase flavoprotein subunit
MCKDALSGNESCGGHFREESLTEKCEAKRNDNEYVCVAAWEYKRESNWELHKEALEFDVVKLTQRIYK